VPFFTQIILRQKALENRPNPFEPNSFIYHFDEGSIGAGRIGRPREKVHSHYSLMVEDEFLDSSAHSGSISFGHSLKLRIVDGTVHHLGMPNAGNTPKTMAPFKEVRHELLDVKTTIKFNLVHLDVVAVLESVA
jgi:hypothetical protein